jgi:hypothetical protein
MTNENPYPSLSLELCFMVAQLANPGSPGRLTPAELAQARKALADAASEARASIRTLPRAAGQDALLFAEALAAASGTLDLIHAGT